MARDLPPRRPMTATNSDTRSVGGCCRSVSFWNSASSSGLSGSPMAASKSARQASQESPGIAPPRSWGVSRAVRRLVLGITAVGGSGWGPLGGSGGGGGGGLSGLFPVPALPIGEEVPPGGPSAFPFFSEPFVTLRFPLVGICSVPIYSRSIAFRILEIAEEAFERGRYVALPAPISERIERAALGVQDP